MRLGLQDVRIWRAQTTLGDDPYAEICLSFLNDLNSYEIFIMRLRKKLDRPGAESVIRTVRSVGYMMDPAS